MQLFFPTYEVPEIIVMVQLDKYVLKFIILQSVQIKKSWYLVAERTVLKEMHNAN